MKVTDIQSSRCLFQLVPLEPPTDATGCSSSDTESVKSSVKPGLKNAPKKGDLLPTPRAMEIAEDPDKFVERNGDRQNSMPNLASMAKYNLLPTPQAFDSANMTETIGENDKVELVGNTFRKVTPTGDFGLGLGRLATFGMLPMPQNLPTPSTG